MGSPPSFLGREKVQKTIHTDQRSRFAFTSLQVVVALLFVEVSFFAIRSGIADVANAIRFAWEGPKLLSETVLSNAILCVIFLGSILCIPKKRSASDFLALIPWVLTLETLIWSGYWYATFKGEAGQPRAGEEGWISVFVVVTAFLSLVSWTTLLVLRKGTRVRVLIAALLQLYFQFSVSFIALMAGMNNWL